MAVLTIGGQDYPAAFNLRSARLFEERTGQSLFSLFASFANDGEEKKPLEINAGLISAAVWSLVNAKRGGPDFEFVEESIGLDDFEGLVRQATDLIPKGLKIDSPLAPATEATSQPTG